MTTRVSRLRRSWILAAALAVCGAGLHAGQQPDRSKAPEIGPPPELHLPAIEKRTLSNGLPVWIVALHKVPVVHAELAIRSGTGADPAQKFGLASLTADMLDEGAGSRTALEIADAVDYLGADLDTSSSSDASYVDLHVPAARLRDALPVMADIVAHPTFPDAELKRLRDERLTSLLQAEDDPQQLVQFAFPRLVYGSMHRYGTASMGTAASLRGFTRADLVSFHAAAYRPQNATLVVTGDVVVANVTPLLESTLGQWKANAAPAPAAPADARQLDARRVYLIDKPWAAQSQIRIGWIGVPRSTPDYFALRVLNTILGGAFTSRLNQNLREAHGYAYGASSTFDMRRAAGPFFAAAGVQTDKTADALKEFFNELTRIHEPVDGEELEKAKNYLSLLLPRNFETTRAAANALAQIAVYDLPQDFYETYGQRVRAVTAADVTRVANKYIQPTKFAVVIVGDRKVIEPGVRALKLGPVTIVEAAEVMK
jgi:predicted Zn-dependent peptidase